MVRVINLQHYKRNNPFILGSGNGALGGFADRPLNAVEVRHLHLFYTNSYNLVRIHNHPNNKTFTDAANDSNIKRLVRKDFDSGFQDLTGSDLSIAVANFRGLDSRGGFGTMRMRN